jgi:multiple sugar transport system ATP-binding protein
MATLELRHVVKRFGPVEVIHGVDLAIADGEFVVFVGPSGCGKSTLLRMIAGLEEISSGDLLIDGERCNAVPSARRNLAMVFQSYALYPHMTVYQNLAFGLENQPLKRAEIDRRVSEAARLLQIDNLLDRKPKALSGGQRQRVAIGRAITREPRVFLFDEPLSNLDAGLRVQMRVELSGLHARLGTTMIYVTHDQVEAMTMADKIVVLRAGKVEQIGRPLALYNNPANQFVAGFIGSPRMNFVDARVLSAAPGEVRVAVSGQGECAVAAEAGDIGPGEELSLGIRPEHIRIAGPAESATIPAEVTLIEQLGGESYVYCICPDRAQIVARLPGQIAVRRGERIGLVFPRGECHLFRRGAGEPALPRAPDLIGDERRISA